MAGLLDGLERGLLSPLGMMGLGLAGGGWQGASQGLLAGFGAQRQRTADDAARQRMEQWRSLAPRLAGQHGVSPIMAEVMGIAGPDKGSASFMDRGEKKYGADLQFDNQRRLIPLQTGAEIGKAKTLATFNQGLERGQIAWRAQNDPLYRAQLEQMTAKPWKTVTAKDGETVLTVNPATGQHQVVHKSDGDSGKKAREKEFAKKFADIYGEMRNEGRLATGLLSDISRLEELSSAVGDQGAVTRWIQRSAPFLTALGVDSGSVKAGEEFEAIINRLAPRMRPIGSGATSDFEMKMFLGSLPQLQQTPEGRKAILEQMRGLQLYNQRAAGIASQVLTGKLTPEQGEQLIQSLPDPFAITKSLRLPQPGSAAPAQPAAGAQPSAQPGAVVEKSGRRWQFIGGDWNNPSSWRPAQ